MRLEDRVRETARLRQLSFHTKKAYWSWTRQYILFHQKRHPEKLGPADVRAFLSHLVCDRRVAISTQRQGSQRARLSGSGTETQISQMNADYLSDSPFCDPLWLLRQNDPVSVRSGVPLGVLEISLANPSSCYSCHRGKSAIHRCGHGDRW